MGRKQPKTCVGVSVAGGKGFFAKVSDSDMQPMPSVKYKAYFKTGEIVKGVTDENGFYEFDNPPSDILDLVIENKPVKPSSDGIGDFLDAVILKEGKKHNG